ncbi:hypothetical protein [Streptomyces cyaneofuscatus]
MSDRTAWIEVCMAEYRITGDMLMSTAFADRIESAFKRAALTEAADLLDAQELEGAALVRYLSTPYTDDVEERRCVGCGDPRDNGKAHGYGAEFGGCV